MDLGIEGKRVAIETIATLVNIKTGMADLILRPAGIPPEPYRPLLDKRDAITGRPLSKRQIALLILAEVEKRPDFTVIVRNIIEIAANFDKYCLIQVVAAQCTDVPIRPTCKSELVSSEQI